MDKIIPEGFDGLIRFTNDSNEDFTSKWGGNEYTFKANTTTPMVILSESARSMIEIRKKFAKEWAMREIMKTDRVKEMNARNKENVGGFGPGMRTALTFSELELEPFVQRCLKPLPAGAVIVKEAKTAMSAEGVSAKNFKPKVTKRIKSTLSGDEDEDQLVTGEIV